jgi:hypothetical protein
MPTQFDFGFLVGLLVGEGHFGGDGRQPHVTLRMHERHQAIFDWLQRTFPGGRVYGPYHHGGRDYLQWMARGAFLRDELAPVLDQFLSPGLDQHSFDRYQLMKARYPQLAAGPGAPALPPDRPRRPASSRPASQRAIQAETTAETTAESAEAKRRRAGDPADFADLFTELREAWPS